MALRNAGRTACATVGALLCLVVPRLVGAQTETAPAGEPAPRTTDAELERAAEKLDVAAQPLPPEVSSALRDAAAALRDAAQALRAGQAKTAPPSAHAAPAARPSLWQAFGDMLDTRLSFALADDDLAAGPSRGSPTFPSAHATEANRVFFDDLDTRDTGFENLTHIAVYAHEPGFLAGIDTEAALVLRLELLPNQGTAALNEDGSYIRLGYDFGGTRLDVLALPVSADRVRLGYTYDITWGGNAIFGALPPGQQPVSPGLKVGIGNETYAVFIGGKTAVVPLRQSDGSVRQDAVWGLLGGARLDVVDELRMEANGGLFQRGVLDRPELKAPGPNQSPPPWLAWGGSLRVGYHVGMPIQESLDLRYYRNDPAALERYFTRETYGPGLSLCVQAEATVLGQTLQDPDRPEATTAQPALAFNVTGRVKVGRTRVHGQVLLRDVNFILFNVPSLLPGQALPGGAHTQPNVLLVLGIDHALESLFLTPGLLIGLELPATVALGEAAGMTVLVSDVGLWQPLLTGQTAKPVFATKATLRWDISDALASAFELQLRYDDNRFGLQNTAGGGQFLVKAEPLSLGLVWLLQARF
jgi:hypothetical protein